MKCTKNKEDTTTFGVVKDIENEPFGLLLSSGIDWGRQMEGNEIKDVGRIRFDTQTDNTFTTGGTSTIRLANSSWNPPTDLGNLTYGKSIFKQLYESGKKTSKAYGVEFIPSKQKPKICTHVPIRGFRPHIARNCSECQKEDRLKVAFRLKESRVNILANNRLKYKVWDCYHMISDDDSEKIIKNYCDVCKCRNENIGT